MCIFIYLLREVKFMKYPMDRFICHASICIFGFESVCSCLACWVALCRLRYYEPCAICVSFQSPCPAPPDAEELALFPCNMLQFARLCVVVVAIVIATEHLMTRARVVADALRNLLCERNSLFACNEIDHGNGPTNGKQ